MKKPRLTLIKNPNFSGLDALDLSELTAAVEHYRSVRLSDPRRSVPMGDIFAVNPDIDTPTLLAYASQNLASMRAIATDLITQLEGPHRSKAWTLQRLTVLTELLVNQARENMGLSESSVKPV